MLRTDLARNEKWILSGAVCNWGNDFKPEFDLEYPYGSSKILDLRD